MYKITTIDPQADLTDLRIVLSAKCDNCAGDGILGSAESKVACHVCGASGRRFYDVTFEEFQKLANKLGETSA